MRPTSTLVQLAVCLSSFAPLASAWPRWLPDLDTIVVRQDGDSSSSAAETGASPTESDPPPTETAKETKTDKKDDMNTAKPTKTDTKKGDSKTTKSIPPNAAVGSVNIQTPLTTAIPTALFKIGDNITLGWNYTGLEVTPDAIDVLLSCSTASETWTLTSNMTFETDVSYIWNSEEQDNNVESPLLTEMYTLIIKDSEAEISQNPSPGYLGSNADFTFGLYHRIHYTPWPEWDCAGCSDASSLFNGQAVKLAFTMSIVTVLTFTWFVTGWGIH